MITFEAVMEIRKRFEDKMKALGLTQDTEILLAYSGGTDSSVLLHLLHSAGYLVSLAHVNYGLRGVESDGDEVFCTETAAALQRRIHVFNKPGFIHQYIQLHHLSIQQAAREIRYQWMQELCVKHSYKAILTAHHQDDNIETVLINLIRGTGVKGLKGIPEVNQNIYRPLLDFSKKELNDYAEFHRLKFRNDSSNQKSEYLRNILRNEVFPKIESAKPGFRKSISGNLINYSFAESCIKSYMQDFYNKFCKEMDEVVYIEKKEITEHAFGPQVLYHLLENYGFLSSQCHEILETAHHSSGAVFKSQTHDLLNDRNHFIVRKSEISQPDEEIQIHSYQEKISHPIALELSVENAMPDFQDLSKNVAYFDLQKLSLPITVRRIQNGDQMQPLGMKGHKKISDILIDSKIDRFKKESMHVLISKGEIIWLIGERMVDSVKITDTTTEFLRVEFSGNL